MADAAESPPLVVDIVISALGPVLVVVVLDEALLVVVHARDVVAWIVWSPKLFHQRSGQRVETVRGDLVSGERLDRDGAGRGIELRRPRIVDRPDGTLDVK